LNLYPCLRPLLFIFDPETAHRLAVRAVAGGWGVPKQAAPDDPALAVKLWGRDFSNPVGLAAGFDKNAETLSHIHKFGFGFVEAGSVTPQPQYGNKKPRVFRLTGQHAVINRYGFNNEGLTAFQARVQVWRESGRTDLLGINISANKDSAKGSRDYVTGLNTLAPYADYVVVNISSPNTPGLRGLQNREELTQLLADTKAARDAQMRPPPLLVKIAPDLTPEMLEDIAEVVLAAGIDGVVISNTTISRPDYLSEQFAREAGGLSGEPLRKMATQVLYDFARLTKGAVPLIGVGGIMNGIDAYKKIRAGATLLQLYTGLIYEGMGLVETIKSELVTLLKRDGFNSIMDAVGADHR
jgi:dihydroorotate dehydrogenase